MTTRLILPLLAAALFVFGCETPTTETQDATSDAQAEAQAFLENYTATFQQLFYVAAEAEWASNTRIVEGDTMAAYETRKANEALADFTGSVDNIEKARALLAQRDHLTPLQTLQVEKVLYEAANNPQTVPDLVKERIRLETELTEKLFGFDFQIDGQSVSPNEIDRRLREDNDLGERLKAWTASKEVGTVLKDGLAQVRDLRNQTVQALDYDDYFAYQVSDYGMTTDEMMNLMRQFNRDLTRSTARSTPGHATNSPSATTLKRCRT